MTFAFAILMALAPIAAAHDYGQNDADEPEEPDPCKFFTLTLTPPDYYRLDPDCPPLGP